MRVGGKGAGRERGRMREGERGRGGREGREMHN